MKCGRKKDMIKWKRWKNTLNKMKTTSFFSQTRSPEPMVVRPAKSSSAPSIECETSAISRTQQTNAFIIMSNSEYFCRKICISCVAFTAKDTLVFVVVDDVFVATAVRSLFFFFFLFLKMYAFMFVPPLSRALHLVRLVCSSALCWCISLLSICSKITERWLYKGNN